MEDPIRLPTLPGEKYLVQKEAGYPRRTLGWCGRMRRHLVQWGDGLRISLLWFAYCLLVQFIMGKDEALNPVDISLLGRVGIILEPNRLANVT